MNKLWLIVKREYLTRVKKRSFILATILTPFAFGLFFIVVGFIFSYEGGSEKKIVILDEGGISKESGFKSESDGSLNFVKSTKPLETLKQEVQDGKYDGVLLIPKITDLSKKETRVQYFSDDQLGLDDQLAISSRVREKLRDYKIDALGFDKKELEALQVKVDVDPKPIANEEQEISELTSVIGAAVGGIMGFIMYITVFIYGMMIMRSVMEEKTSRIVEVMISSVKPFQLMMGKIIGVGFVGLTQLAIWAVLLPAISIAVNLIFGFDFGQMDTMETAAAAQNIDPEDAQAIAAQAFKELNAINWWAV
ncbi:MAG: ABC transporter permease, partial [Bacteroidota bacterium]